jgi:acyl carrier protein
MTMIVEVKQRVTAILSDVLEVGEEEVASLRSGQARQWDSVAHASIIIALEEEFGIVIDPDVGSELVDVDTIASVVKRLRT